MEKKQLINEQQCEIRDKIATKKDKDLKELKKNLDELDIIDRDFQIRELKIAQHHQKIAERDKEIFNIYNSPAQITHSKFEVNKNNHIGELNNILLMKD